jgi:hypothetical protein
MWGRISFCLLLLACAALGDDTAGIGERSDSTQLTGLGVADGVSEALLRSTGANDDGQEGGTDLTSDVTREHQGKIASSDESSAPQQPTPASSALDAAAAAVDALGLEVHLTGGGDADVFGGDGAASQAGFEEVVAPKPHPPTPPPSHDVHSTPDAVAHADRAEMVEIEAGRYLGSDAVAAGEHAAIATNEDGAPQQLPSPTSALDGVAAAVDALGSGVGASGGGQADTVRGDGAESKGPKQEDGPNAQPSNLGHNSSPDVSSTYDLVANVGSVKEADEADAEVDSESHVEAIGEHISTLMDESDAPREPTLSLSAVTGVVAVVEARTVGVGAAGEGDADVGRGDDVASWGEEEGVGLTPHPQPPIPSPSHDVPLTHDLPADAYGIKGSDTVEAEVERYLDSYAVATGAEHASAATDEVDTPQELILPLSAVDGSAVVELGAGVAGVGDVSDVGDDSAALQGGSEEGIAPTLHLSIPPPSPDDPSDHDLVARAGGRREKDTEEVRDERNMGTHAPATGKHVSMITDDGNAPQERAPPSSTLAGVAAAAIDSWEDSVGAAGLGDANNMEGDDAASGGLEEDVVPATKPPPLLPPQSVHSTHDMVGHTGDDMVGHTGDGIPEGEQEQATSSETVETEAARSSAIDVAAMQEQASTASDEDAFQSRNPSPHAPQSSSPSEEGARGTAGLNDSIASARSEMEGDAIELEAARDRVATREQITAASGEDALQPGDAMEVAEPSPPSMPPLEWDGDDTAGYEDPEAADRPLIDLVLWMRARGIPVRWECDTDPAVPTVVTNGSPESAVMRATHCSVALSLAVREALSAAIKASKMSDEDRLRLADIDLSKDELERTRALLTTTEKLLNTTERQVSHLLKEAAEANNKHSVRAAETHTKIENGLRSELKSTADSAKQADQRILSLEAALDVKTKQLAETEALYLRVNRENIGLKVLSGGHEPERESKVDPQDGLSGENRYPGGRGMRDALELSRACPSEDSVPSTLQAQRAADIQLIAGIDTMADEKLLRSSPPEHDTSADVPPPEEQTTSSSSKVLVKMLTFARLCAAKLWSMSLPIFQGVNRLAWESPGGVLLDTEIVKMVGRVTHVIWQVDNIFGSSLAQQHDNINGTVQVAMFTLLLCVLYLVHVIWRRVCAFARALRSRFSGSTTGDSDEKGRVKTEASPPVETGFSPISTGEYKSATIISGSTGYTTATAPTEHLGYRAATSSSGPPGYTTALSRPAAPPPVPFILFPGPGGVQSAVDDQGSMEGAGDDANAQFADPQSNKLTWKPPSFSPSVTHAARPPAQGQMYHSPQQLHHNSSLPPPAPPAAAGRGGGGATFQPGTLLPPQASYNRPGVGPGGGAPRLLGSHNAPPHMRRPGPPRVGTVSATHNLLPPHVAPGRLQGHAPGIPGRGPPRPSLGGGAPGAGGAVGGRGRGAPEQ